jgi:hypothetical protein
MKQFSETLKKFFMRVAKFFQDVVVQAMRPALLSSPYPAPRGVHVGPLLSTRWLWFMPTLFFGTAKAGAEERNNIDSRFAPWAVYAP